MQNTSKPQFPTQQLIDRIIRNLDESHDTLLSQKSHSKMLIANQFDQKKIQKKNHQFDQQLVLGLSALKSPIRMQNNLQSNNEDGDSACQYYQEENQESSFLERQQSNNNTLNITKRQQKRFKRQMGQLQQNSIQNPDTQNELVNNHEQQESMYEEGESSCIQMQNDNIRQKYEKISSQTRFLKLELNQLFKSKQAQSEALTAIIKNLKKQVEQFSEKSLVQQAVNERLKNEVKMIQEQKDRIILQKDNLNEQLRLKEERIVQLMQEIKIHEELQERKDIEIEKLGIRLKEQREVNEMNKNNFMQQKQRIQREWQQRLINEGQKSRQSILKQEQYWQNQLKRVKQELINENNRLQQISKIQKLKFEEKLCSQKIILQQKFLNQRQNYQEKCKSIRIQCQQKIKQIQFKKQQKIHLLKSTLQTQIKQKNLQLTHRNHKINQLTQNYDQLLNQIIHLRKQKQLQKQILQKSEKHQTQLTNKLSTIQTQNKNIYKKLQQKQTLIQFSKDQLATAQNKIYKLNTQFTSNYQSQKIKMQKLIQTYKFNQTKLSNIKNLFVQTITTYKTFLQDIKKTSIYDISTIESQVRNDINKFVSQICIKLQKKQSQAPTSSYNSSNRNSVIIHNSIHNGYNQSSLFNRQQMLEFQIQQLKKELVQLKTQNYQLKYEKKKHDDKKRNKQNLKQIIQNLQYQNQKLNSKIQSLIKRDQINPIQSKQSNILNEYPQNMKVFNSKPSSISKIAGQNLKDYKQFGIFQKEKKKKDIPCYNSNNETDEKIIQQITQMRKRIKSVKQECQVRSTLTK